MPELNPVLPAFESVLVAFESQWSDTAQEICCAFANTSGGALYFGIADNGEVVGVSHPDEVERSVLSVFRFAMQPPCDNLCRTERLIIANKIVVVAHVAEGSRSPYSVTMKTKGGAKRRIVFVRRGPANREASDEELRALYRKSDPTPYELQTAREQDLTFETLAQFFKAADIAFSEKNYATLGITNRLGFFTHLGFWLSDECTVETRVGFFLGEDKTSQTDGLFTFTGCIIDQYNKIRALLHNRFGFSHQIAPFQLTRKGTRDEISDYPENAVREALVNLFAHRDYSKEGLQAAVSVFSNRMELVSFGGLPPDCDEAHLLEGISVPRNARLADLLMRLSAKEKQGIGIPAIFGAYKPFGLEPQLVCAPTLIKIILPRIKAFPVNLTEREQQVVDYLKKNPDASSRAVQDFLGMSYATTFNTLQALLKKNLVVRTGSGRTTRYCLT